MKTMQRVRMGQLFSLFVAASVCLTLISCSEDKREQSDTEGAVLASYEMGAELNGDVIVFSHDSGVYPDESISVALTAPEGCTIAFTTDGSTPTASNSTSSEVELNLDRSLSGNLVAQRDLMINPDIPHEIILDDPSLPFGVVVTACAVNESGKLSDPVSKTYFLGVDFADRFPNCVVVSLTTDPENLLNYDTGILANGAVYDDWRQSQTAQEIIDKEQTWLVETNGTQRGKDWERPCRLQIYDM
ncbi:MAG: chitobiase/beta-hexosaminidase C-terminal domain-containing protein, partial [Eggerthellaceae bacterium]|nr:chitobiase/beta-hexosaminidase C-terminal domain-containing protein [Eggerthellaceae bacterium]